MFEKDVAVDTESFWPELFHFVAPGKCFINSTQPRRRSKTELLELRHETARLAPSQ